MTPNRTWKRMVVAADMKYMVFRPKLWMYLATSRVETSLKMSEEVETVCTYNYLEHQKFDCNERGLEPDKGHNDGGPVCVLVYSLSVY